MHSRAALDIISKTLDEPVLQTTACASWIHCRQHKQGSQQPEHHPSQSTHLSQALVVPLLHCGTIQIWQNDMLHAAQANTTTSYNADNLQVPSPPHTYMYGLYAICR
jgi:hypothetical protein